MGASSPDRRLGFCRLLAPREPEVQPLLRERLHAWQSLLSEPPNWHRGLFLTSLGLEFVGSLVQMFERGGPQALDRSLGRR